MSNYIPLSVPSLNGNELQYVKDCIDTEWVSSAGNYVGLFEKNTLLLTHYLKLITFITLFRARLLNRNRFS